MIHIQHLYISSGHNFFGLHGSPAGAHPLIEVETIECVAGRGVRGDRFFDFKENYKGQITFFASEVLDALCRELSVANAPGAATRRNVITQGVDLNVLIGRHFTIQDIEFEGVSECAPCYWMDQAIGPGAEKWLTGRGGLRARIVTSGFLRVDVQS